MCHGSAARGATVRCAVGGPRRTRVPAPLHRTPAARLSRSSDPLVSAMRPPVGLRGWEWAVPASSTPAGPMPWMADSGACEAKAQPWAVLRAGGHDHPDDGGG